MEIQIRKKNVYGKEMIYPACEKAVLFSGLVNKKTFSENDISLIEKLGYTVKQVF